METYECAEDRQEEIREALMGIMAHQKLVNYVWPFVQKVHCSQFYLSGIDDNPICDIVYPCVTPRSH